MEKTRNFCIIAHIDHGKSTLADRLLEITNTVPEREQRAQYLDSMDLEREKGITIKASAVTMFYKAKSGETYKLNMIDTPGHVDFTYEVSRAIASCEGALLVVDASQGVEAQTLANAYLAIEHNLEIIPVINKIDLPSADIERCKRELEEIIGLDGEGAVLISAKTGQNVDAVLEELIKRIPAPCGDREQPLKALVFDAQYDNYRGVITYIRVQQGSIRTGEKILFMQGGNVFEVSEIGIFNPTYKPTQILTSGDVGYVMANIRTVAEAMVGDTITSALKPAGEKIPGYRVLKPMVFCGLYPSENEEYQALRENIEKYQLNDAAFVFEPETSAALGAGFRCGFLGLLHLEIVVERLKREYGLDLISTIPSVIYRITGMDDKVLEIDNPLKLPDPSSIKQMEEPVADLKIYTPEKFVGGMMELLKQKRGTFKNMHYIGGRERVELSAVVPLSELIIDFYDKLKSRSSGYASMEYELSGYQSAELVRVDILVNGDQVDAFSQICTRERAYDRGRILVERLKEVIPSHMFTIPLQAAIGGKIIARETIRAMRKNVLAKCYGGDITRKRKLLEKQKEGKKKMKAMGSVSIPNEAFTRVLKLSDD
ncbi:MAG: translation elongation factor 4 [Candidatus Wallbacteria bacterium]|nr:translation elongation factor 4 [Candidatus Wallbacteria bacterium]